MRPDQIIRAWKDQRYWHSLSKKERSQIPENPAGALELADELLAEISGGTASYRGEYLGEGKLQLHVDELHGRLWQRLRKLSIGQQASH